MAVRTSSPGTASCISTTRRSSKRPSERQCGQARIEHRRRHPVDDPEGGEERPGGEGIHQVLRPAEGRRRVHRARAGPLAAGHAGARQEPILAGPEGPASARLRPAGPPRPDRAGLLRVQPGDGGSPLPTRVEHGDDRRREGRREGGSGGRQGIQAHRGDLLQVQEGVRAETNDMNGTSVIDVGRPAIRRRTLSRSLRGGLKGGEYTWAVAFVVPYIAVFLTFVAYPVVYGLWMGSEASLYRELFADPIYQSTVVNTVLYLALGVNVKMFLALLLSGFFMRPGWWMKLLLLIFVLPWAVPQISTYISIHWMLNGEWGFLNNVLYTLFHVEGPSWLNDRWMALGAVIVAHIWKWTPFWTLIMLAGRMAIPLEIRDTARVDGATGLRGFVHITFPLLANLYLICTLLSTIFLLGDFNAVTFVSGGGPANSTHVLATLGIRNAFEIAQPRLGVAAVMTALPLVIPLVIVLMRRLRTAEVQL